jgi:hypothetical protein
MTVALVALVAGMGIGFLAAIGANVALKSAIDWFAMREEEP